MSASVLVALPMASLVLISCAGPKRIAGDGRNDNLRNFVRLLKAGQIEKAGRFALYLEPARTREHEVFAQYYLSSCQPHRAQTEIARIEEQERRDLYAAVLLSLVAVERPSREPMKTKNIESETKALKKKAVATESQASYRFPVQDEVWADEWDVLEVRVQCEKMPLVADVQLREKYRRLAREFFARVNPQVMTQEFSLVALGLDVDLVPADLPLVLEKYSARGSDPYYKRLVMLSQKGREDAAPKVTATSLASHEFELDALDLSQVRQSPQAVEIPMLLQ